MKCYHAEELAKATEIVARLNDEFYEINHPEYAAVYVAATEHFVGIHLNELEILDTENDLEGFSYEVCRQRIIDHASLLLRAFHQPPAPEADPTVLLVLMGPEKLQAYRESGGTVCPCCGARSVISRQFVDQGAIGKVRTWCPACSAQFEETWSLTGLSQLEYT